MGKKNFSSSLLPCCRMHWISLESKPRQGFYKVFNNVVCIFQDPICVHAAFPEERLFNSSNERHQMLSHSWVKRFEIRCVAVEKGERLDKQLWHQGYHTQLSRHSGDRNRSFVMWRQRGRGRGGGSCRVAAVNSQGKHNWHCVPTITAVVCLSEGVCVCVCVPEVCVIVVKEERLAPTDGFTGQEEKFLRINKTG